MHAPQLLGNDLGELLVSRCRQLGRPGTEQKETPSHTTGSPRGRLAMSEQVAVIGEPVLHGEEALAAIPSHIPDPASAPGPAATPSHTPEPSASMPAAPAAVSVAPAMAPAPAPSFSTSAQDTKLEELQARLAEAKATSNRRRGIVEAPAPEAPALHNAEAAEDDLDASTAGAEDDGLVYNNEAPDTLYMRAGMDLETGAPAATSGTAAVPVDIAGRSGRSRVNFDDENDDDDGEQRDEPGAPPAKGRGSRARVHPDDAADGYRVDADDADGAGGSTPSRRTRWWRRRKRARARAADGRPREDFAHVACRGRVCACCTCFGLLAACIGVPLAIILNQPPPREMPPPLDVVYMVDAAFILASSEVLSGQGTPATAGSGGPAADGPASLLERLRSVNEIGRVVAIDLENELASAAGVDALTVATTSVAATPSEACLLLTLAAANATTAATLVAQLEQRMPDAASASATLELVTLLRGLQVSEAPLFVRRAATYNATHALGGPGADGGPSALLGSDDGDGRVDFSLNTTAMSAECSRLLGRSSSQARRQLAHERTAMLRKEAAAPPSQDGDPHRFLAVFDPPPPPPSPPPSPTLPPPSLSELESLRWTAIAASGNASRLVAASASDRNGGWLWGSDDGGRSWRMALDDTQRVWRRLASSRDGRTLVAAVRGGRLWRSIDAGYSWEEDATVGVPWDAGASSRKVSTPSDFEWADLAISADGHRMAAVVTYGNLWTSDDRGATWREDVRSTLARRPWYEKSLTALCMSDDGTSMVLAVNLGHLWRSADGGTNWTEDTSIGAAKSWYGLASSADGAVVAAVASAGGIWHSHDGGASWGAGSFDAGGVDGPSRGAPSAISNSAGTATQTAGQASSSSSSGTQYTQLDWHSVTVSSDGRRMAAVARGSGVWVSADYGLTWRETTLSQEAGRQLWLHTADASEDGQSVVAVGAYGDGIWRSYDAGAGWVNLLSPPPHRRLSSTRAGARRGANNAGRASWLQAARAWPAPTRGGATQTPQLWTRSSA